MSLDLASQYRQPLVLLSGIATGLFDFLVEKEMATAGQVAKHFNWDLRGTEIFLHALCGINCLKKENDKFRFADECRDDFSREKYP
ncbi:MAG: methyltransferase dimerization domain-containing protein, partial [Calditrichia bacterium]